MSKKFILVVAICILGLIAIFTLTRPKANAPSSSNSNAQPSNHVEGEGTAGVTLVEYGDYECPICEAYYPVVKAVQAEYNDQIHFQFRNLPLFQIHQNAFAAARAAEAASLQNKFWEMHDMLYEQANWQVWTNSSTPVTYFNNYAQQLGLDVNKFKQDYASGQVNDTINADLAAFNKTGQQEATPTFFLDGKYVSNGLLATNTGPSIDMFNSVIKAEISAKNK